MSILKVEFLLFTVTAMVCNFGAIIANSEYHPNVDANLAGDAVKVNCDDTSTVNCQPTVFMTTTDSTGGEHGHEHGGSSNDYFIYVIIAGLVVGLFFVVILALSKIMRCRKRFPTSTRTPSLQQVQPPVVFTGPTLPETYRHVMSDSEARDREILRAMGIVLPANVSATSILHHQPPPYSSIISEKLEVEMEPPPPYNSATMNQSTDTVV